jgi:hypothetical protein
VNSTQEARLGHELRQLVSDQPFTPDMEAIGQRARRRRRRGRALRGATAAGAAVLVAGGLFTAVLGRAGTATGTAASHAPAANPRLMGLASFVQASSGSLPGDASLVVTTETMGGKQLGADYFLYTDSGAIYSADSESGLATAISRHKNIADGTEAREVKVASYAANGNLTTAQEMMVKITGSNLGLGLSLAERQQVWAKAIVAQEELLKEKGIRPQAGSPAGKALEEEVGNRLWISSMDALTAGGGNPQVRAGLLRLLATVPEVTVANTTTDGEAALTLTAGPKLFGGGSPEVLTINAKTGSPIKFSSPADGDVPSVTVTYQVSRVTLADIAAGRS